MDISGGLYKVMYVEALKLRKWQVVVFTTSDITSALNNENIRKPVVVRNDAIVMSVRAARSYTEAEDFEYLVVKRASDNTATLLP